MGDTLIRGLNLVIPPLKFFSNILKNNASLVKFLATATTVLVGALIAMGIIFLVAGSIAMLISVYQKLMEKSALLRGATMFLSKTFKGLLISIKKVAVGMVNAFRGVGRKIVGGITSGLKFLIPKFIAIGARAGLFFGAAFNILANAFIGAGAWLKRLAIKLAGIFVAMGVSAGGAFGGAFTAASRAIMSAGAWITTMLAVIAVKLGLGGAVSGVAFGTGFTASSAITMKSGAWISGVIASISVRFAAFGAAIGAAFGAVWTTSARLIMIAGGWISVIMTKIAIASRLGGTLAGASFGTAFIIAAAAILSVGLADLIGDILFKKSILKDIGLPSIIDIFKDITGIELPTGVAGGPPGTVKGAVATDIKINEFLESLRDLFQNAFPNIPEAGAVSESGTEDKVSLRELLGEQLVLLEKSNEILAENNEIFEESSEILAENNVLGKTANKLVELSNKITAININTINIHTEFLTVLIEHLRLNIIEVIRNINEMSALTTVVALTQLMFARLVAEGNRAAGKLASLRVSSRGRFSIRDPGISAIDRRFIAQAKLGFETTRANQLVLDQNIEILINPVITVENGGTESAEQIANTITDELDIALRKRIGAIVST